MGRSSWDWGATFISPTTTLKTRLRIARSTRLTASSICWWNSHDLMIPLTRTMQFYELMVAGLQPIITHPERNLTIQRHPERMKEWLREGCLVQVTAASLTGRFGRTAQSLAMQFLEKDWVNFLATDAHNLESRPPKLREAYDIVAKRFGTETAKRLCVDNPRAVFFGEEMPEQPAPKGIEEESRPPQGRRKKGLLGRLFSG